MYWAHILRQHPLFTDQIPPALMPLWRQQTNRTAGRWGKTREAQKHTPSSTCAVKGAGYPRSPGRVSSCLGLLPWPDLQLRLLKVSTTTVAGGQVWAQWLVDRCGQHPWLFLSLRLLIYQIRKAVCTASLGLLIEPPDLCCLRNLLQLLLQRTHIRDSSSRNSSSPSRFTPLSSKKP